LEVSRRNSAARATGRLRVLLGLRGRRLAELQAATIKPLVSDNKAGLDLATMNYQANELRYEAMHYKRCGHSGLLLPRIALGLWHNFGEQDNFENARRTLRGAFDLGITHFDLANNYGPPPGSAEETLGRILSSDLKPYRDELIISTKAGYDMWKGPYGNFGSRKYLLASLDQSLRRLGVDYVDIFYHHRPDPQTPIQESMGALEHAVRSGKALYVGLSNYDAQQTQEAISVLKDMGIRCLVHQPCYNIFNRWVEPSLLSTLEQTGLGAVVFSPLAQGLLTNRYLENIPADSRAGRAGPFLKPGDITEERLRQIRALDSLAKSRGQTLAQLALAWVLRQPAVTSALIGASQLNQVADCVLALQNLELTKEELSGIDAIVAA
jgi:L-glyceraldehyde 3-phosphate reductase